MQYKDYYEVLGVPRTATKQDIQKAYRRLARKYHPDVNQDKAAEDRFKEISEANEVLADEDKRARYDQLGSAWNQAQGSNNGPGFDDFFQGFSGAGGRGQTVRDFEFSNQGFSSFFEMLFGGAAGGQGGGPQSARGWPGRGQGTHGRAGSYSQDGSNVEATISLPLEEAAAGGQREVSITDPTTGRPKKLRVSLPPGLRRAQKIRLAGQGAPGIGGGTPGDLFLTVDFAPHPHFKIEGHDLHYRLEVTPWQAALGCEVSVPTLTGSVTVRIPAGTSSNRKVRLRGKGYPRSKGGPGDLFAEVSIVVPSELTSVERELFERLAAESSFTPAT